MKIKRLNNISILIVLGCLITITFLSQCSKKSPNLGSPEKATAGTNSDNTNEEETSPSANTNSVQTPAPFKNLEGFEDPTQGILNPTIFSVSYKGDLYWVPSRLFAPLPANAVVGGVDFNSKQLLYVCRGFYVNGVHAGKLIGGRCNIGWGDREMELTEYQVLTGTTLAWHNPFHGISIPPKSYVAIEVLFPDYSLVIGGQEPGGVLYVCFLPIAFGTHPGKLIPIGTNRDDWPCHVGYGGKEIRVDEWEDVGALYGLMGSSRVNLTFSGPVEANGKISMIKPGSEFELCDEPVTAGMSAERVAVALGRVSNCGGYRTTVSGSTVSIDERRPVFMIDVKPQPTFICFDDNGHHVNCDRYKL